MGQDESTRNAMTKSLIVSICLLYGCATLGQAVSSGSYKVLVSKILEGDRNSIYKAGGTGDKRFVSLLRELIRRHRNRDKPVHADSHVRGLNSESITGAARLAL